MSPEVIEQARFFVIAISWGIVLMWLYDGVRLRRLYRVSRQKYQIIEEMIYWIWMSIVIFLILRKSHQGLVRNYIVLGMMAGMLFYHYFLSSYYMRLMRKLMKPFYSVRYFFRYQIDQLEKRLQNLLQTVKIKIEQNHQKKHRKESGEKNG